MFVQSLLHRRVCVCVSLSALSFSLAHPSSSACKRSAFSCSCLLSLSPFPMKVNVAAFDYTGYGLHEGTPSENACYDDVRGVYGTTAVPAFSNSPQQELNERTYLVVLVPLSVADPEQRDPVRQAHCVRTFNGHCCSGNTHTHTLSHSHSLHHRCGKSIGSAVAIDLVSIFSTRSNHRSGKLNRDSRLFSLSPQRAVHVW
jgi:hypothetical protein